MTISLIVNFVFSWVMVIISTVLLIKSLITLDKIAATARSYAGLPMELKNMILTDWWLIIIIISNGFNWVLGGAKEYGWVSNQYMAILVIVVVLFFVACINYYFYDYSDAHIKRKPLVKRDKRRISFILFPMWFFCVWSAFVVIYGFIQGATS